MLDPSASIPTAATSINAFFIGTPSIWIASRSSLDRSDAIHSARCAAELAGRDVVEHQVRRPFPEQILRLGRFPARQRKFAARRGAHPRACDTDSAPVEVDFALGFAPAIGRFAVQALIAATAEGGGVLLHHLGQVATPAVRQKRSKLAPTASQASVTRAVAFTAERVLVVFRALPFSVDSTPRAYTLKAGNADFPISTRGGTSPAQFTASRIADGWLLIEHNYRF